MCGAAIAQRIRYALPFHKRLELRGQGRACIADQTRMSKIICQQPWRLRVVHNEGGIQATHLRLRRRLPPVAASGAAAAAAVIVGSRQPGGKLNYESFLLRCVPHRNAAATGMRVTAWRVGQPMRGLSAALEHSEMH